MFVMCLIMFTWYMPDSFVWLFYIPFLHQTSSNKSCYSMANQLWQHTAVSFFYYCLLTEASWGILKLRCLAFCSRTEELPGWSAQWLWRVWEPAVPPQLVLNQTYSIKGQIIVLNQALHKSLNRCHKWLQESSSKNHIGS